MSIKATGGIHSPKWKKILFIVTSALTSIFLIAFFSYALWKSSGTNEWKLEKDENGIKIYTLKTPGYNLKKVKATMRVKSTLSGIVFLLRDPSVADEVAGAKDMQVFEKIDQPYYFSAYYTYKLDMPLPFGMRELVILFQYRQDPKTKIIEVNTIAAPNKIPPNGDYVRIKYMNNIWKLTPVSGGEVDVEAYTDMDIEGPIPYLLENLALPEVMYTNFLMIRDLLQKDTFQNAKVAFIRN